MSASIVQNRYPLEAPSASSDAEDEPLLNARQVAVRLGVSERWVRDHTTRRWPRIPGVKLGPLMRHRREDVDAFMRELDTTSSSPGPRRGV
jgi:excisionase family DNA binding protein